MTIVSAGVSNYFIRNVGSTSLRSQKAITLAWWSGAESAKSERLQPQQCMVCVLWTVGCAFMWASQPTRKPSSV